MIRTDLKNQTCWRQSDGSSGGEHFWCKSYFKTFVYFGNWIIFDVMMLAVTMMNHWWWSLLVMVMVTVTCQKDPGYRGWSQGSTICLPPDPTYSLSNAPNKLLQYSRKSRYVCYQMIMRCRWNRNIYLGGEKYAANETKGFVDGKLWHFTVESSILKCSWSKVSFIINLARPGILYFLDERRQKVQATQDPLQAPPVTRLL